MKSWSFQNHSCMCISGNQISRNRVECNPARYTKIGWQIKNQMRMKRSSYTSRLWLNLGLIVFLALVIYPISGFRPWNFFCLICALVKFFFSGLPPSSLQLTRWAYVAPMWIFFLLLFFFHLPRVLKKLIKIWDK